MQKKTKVVFSFDTEDFVNDFAAESILRCARILREEGAKGCFQVVGLLAEALKKWGRQDVIDELKNHHEIGFHSYTHSVHPNLVELTDVCDPRAASAAFDEREREGIRIVKEIFGRESLASAVPPGASFTYIAQYGYHRLGIPVYAASPVKDKVSSRPISFCNMTQLRYNFCLDDTLFSMDEEGMKKVLDEKAAGQEVFVIYHHPNIDCTSEFWDAINFNGRNTDPDKYVPSPKRPPEETELFFERFRKLVRMIREDDRFEFGTFGDYAGYFDGKRTVTEELLKKLIPQLDQALFPVTEPESLCLSDIFYSFADVFKGLPLRECGEVSGFICEPYAITESVKLKAEDVINSARLIRENDFLPEIVWVGDRALGPADWLRAAVKTLKSEKDFTLDPGPWQIDLGQFPTLRDLKLGELWYDCECSNFRDRYLSDRLRLQSWTIRLPAGTKRMIF
ncbi:MAG: hypothetical protein IJV00_01410 [Clostridia bacterium]|nr:hypothetical protein [Clostridia bacterium]